jgi:hypothetical protein
MTNFIFDDGVMLEVGQQWTIILHTGRFTGTIISLYPTREKVVIEFDVNIMASITTGENVDGYITWDLMWSSFKTGYEVGTLFRYNTGKPTKRIPPLNFI